MGNCSLKGDTTNTTKRGPELIRIVTDSGQVIELQGPKIVGDVLNNFPGYAIFLRGQMSSPLSKHEELLNGKFYYMLPKTLKPVREEVVDECFDQAEHPFRASSVEESDLVTNLTSGSAVEVLPSSGNGVWKVKLVIGTKELEDILSGQDNAEALIEQMRMAATSATNSLSIKSIKSSWGVSRKPNLFNALSSLIAPILRRLSYVSKGFFCTSSKGLFGQHIMKLMFLRRFQRLNKLLEEAPLSIFSLILERLKAMEIISINFKKFNTGAIQSRRKLLRNGVHGMLKTRHSQAII
ncbi:PADRE domain [Dillenia turbinata]|uniref:PADRE domain n=1 Tax=Dillenia turbinata TaxID=194707 RepID=A0AAN8VKX7_9MAGN